VSEPCITWFTRQESDGNCSLARGLGNSDMIQQTILASKYHIIVGHTINN